MAVWRHFYLFLSSERNRHGNTIDCGIANIGAEEGPDVAPECLFAAAGLMGTDVTLGSLTQLLQRGMDGFRLSCSIDVAVIHCDILLFYHFSCVSPMFGGSFIMALF